MIAFQFVTMTLLPPLMTFVLVLIERTRKDRKLSFQILAGILFGLCAVYGTEFGVNTGLAIFNTRDAAVICSGLFFGWPAAIISAVIGSVERFLAPLWGTGEYTRLACSIATFCAGIFTSIIVKFFFTDRPRWYHGLSMGAFIEVFHMIMVFVTHPNDLHKAFTVIQSTSVVMIAMNSLSVVIAIVAVDFLDKVKLELPDKKRISVQFNYGLSIAMLISFAVSVFFIAKLERTISIRDTESLLKANIADVKNELENGTDKDTAVNFRHIGTEGYIVIEDNTTEDSTGSLISKQPGKEGTISRISTEGSDFYCLYETFRDVRIIAVIPVYEARFSEMITVSLTVFLELLVFAVLYLMILYLVDRLVIRNIRSVNDDLKSITEGNLDVILKADTNKEFLSLSDGINSTVDKLKTLIAEAGARIDAELEFAKQIQLQSLPAVSGCFEGRNDFDLYATMFTAKEVGGDFYDFFVTKDGRLFFLIADVSGKGIPASLFMMKAKAQLRELAENCTSVSNLAATANNSLSENNEAGLFVTAWIGCIDPSAKTLTYVNAGHNPPVFLNKERKPMFIRNLSGLVLGAISGVDYEEYSHNLQSGDCLLLYTDGVTEATDQNGNLYTEERLIDCLSVFDENSNASDVCKYVKKSVDSFVKDAEQFDDITMLGIRYIG